MRVRGGLLLPILTILGVGLASPAAAAWIADVETGVVYEDNLSFASMDRDIKGAAALLTSASGGAAAYLTDRHSVSLTGDVVGDLHERYSGLDHIALGVTAAFRSKLGLGADAPWVRVAASGGRLQYRVDVRDGWYYRVAAGIGKRFGPRWELRADYAFDGRTADHERPVTPRLPADVFDQQAHTFSARADFQATPALLVFGGYACRLGDVASHDPAERPDLRGVERRRGRSGVRIECLRLQDRCDDPHPERGRQPRARARAGRSTWRMRTRSGSATAGSTTTTTS